MGKRVAIIQSNYVPWKGYFDAINAVDEFILLDEVQYTRRDWRNRNRIKSPDGMQWLTIPVVAKGRYHQRIDETAIAEPGVGERHWKTLSHVYRRAPHFDAVAERLERHFTAAPWERLSDVNRQLTEAVCGCLGIETPILWSTDYDAADATRGERILELCLQAGADEYVSGPAARAYLEEDRFARAGVNVRWLDYSGYPPYPQLGEPFEHGVSVLDLLFNTGADAPAYMKTFGDGDHGLF
jgi:hypothetical protein